MKKSWVLSVIVAAGMMATATSAHAFDTTVCASCHNLDTPKVGPDFKSVVSKYGNEKALAKVFESGFAIKDRKIAMSDKAMAKKAVVMTVQYKLLIKGRGKDAAHALFETVKDNTFGNY